VKSFGNAYSIFENPSFTGLGKIDKIIGKSIVILDEMKLETVGDYNALKNMVTSDRISFRPMYRATVDVENHCKFIVLTNESEPINRKGAGERRFPEFTSAEVPKHNNYFKVLYGLDELLFPYYFIKKIQDKQFVDACLKFNFRNYGTKAGDIKKLYKLDNAKIGGKTSGEIPVNYKKFVLYLFTDPKGKGKWYHFDSKYEEKVYQADVVFGHYKQTFDKYHYETEDMEKQQFTLRLNGILFHKLEKKSSQKSKPTFDRKEYNVYDLEKIKTNFMAKDFAGFDPTVLGDDSETIANNLPDVIAEILDHDSNDIVTKVDEKEKKKEQHPLDSNIENKKVEKSPEEKKSKKKRNHLSLS